MTISRKPCRPRTETIEQFATQDYKFGFVTDVEQETFPPGLNEDVIRPLSAKKDEPEWMLEWRLKAYRHWLTMKEPTWANVHYPPIDYQAIIYYAGPKPKGSGPKSLDEVDPEILETYEKLGIPLHEQEILAGVAVDAVFDSVSVATTFKAKLAEMGIIFCSFSEAVQQPSRPGPAVPRLGGALHRQLLRHAQLGGLLATARSSTSPRACAARWSCRPTSASTPGTPGSSSAR